MRGSLKTWLVLGLLLGTMAYAIAEDLTLVTYYPSPRGVYKELQVTDLVLNPPGNLTVPGSLAVGPTYTPGAAGNVLIEGNLAIQTTTPVVGSALTVGSGNVTVSDGDLKVNLEKGLFSLDGQEGFFVRAGHLLEFVTSGSTKMTLDAAGNLGIGTPAPGSKLHVNTTAANAFQLQVNTDRLHLQKSVLPGRWNLTLVPTAPGTSNLMLSDSVALPANFDLIVVGQASIGSQNPPTASAVLQLDSTTQGFLPPRMNDTQRDNIVGPADGLMIYNTSDETVDYFNDTTWVSLGPPTLTFFQAIANPTTTTLALGSHDVCVQSGFSTYDSVQSDNGNPLICQMSVAGTSWTLTADVGGNSGESITCFATCLDWN